MKGDIVFGYIKLEVVLRRSSRGVKTCVFIYGLFAWLFAKSLGSTPNCFWKHLEK